MTQPVLEVTDLKKSYRSPDGGNQPVIDVPHLALACREQVGLKGESGSGKTTLLHLIAGIVRADSGRISLDGQEVTGLAEAKRDRLRANTLGYVFQTFHLLPGYTALENVLLGMTFGPGADRAFAKSLLKDLGLEERMNHCPRQLSIGQQQRVALARALANRPQLVIADEPTGSLDPGSARTALDLIRNSCTTHNAALLLVSHDEQLLGDFERVEKLADINRAVTAEGASR
ncbi:MAG: ABC transporter ATP-binding protein [Planctomycetota bacterium]